MKKKYLLFLAPFLLLSPNSKADKNSRVLTDLSGKSCKVTPAPNSEEDPVGGETYLCPGVGGYSIEYGYSDERVWMNLIYPNKSKQDINPYQVFQGFTQVVSKAEWKVAHENNKVVPKALIIELKGSGASEVGNKKETFYLITKIDAQKSCLVQKINKDSSSQEKINRLLDSIGQQQCIQSVIIN